MKKTNEIENLSKKVYELGYSIQLLEGSIRRLTEMLIKVKWPEQNTGDENINLTYNQLRDKNLLFEDYGRNKEWN